MIRPERSLTPMKRSILKLLIVCGLALSLCEASQYLAARRYLRRDFLLLTVIEDRLKQKTEAGYPSRQKRAPFGLVL